MLEYLHFAFRFRPKASAQLLHHHPRNARPRTVEGHRNNMLLKTGAKNTVGLVVYAMTKGYYTPQ